MRYTFVVEAGYPEAGKLLEWREVFRGSRPEADRAFVRARLGSHPAYMDVVEFRMRKEPRVSRLIARARVGKEAARKTYEELQRYRDLVGDPEPLDERG